MAAPGPRPEHCDHRGSRSRRRAALRPLRVVYDGVVGPWFLPTFFRASGLAHLQYVVLLPPLDLCIERVHTRVDHGFTDLSVTRDMHRQFAAATVDSRHVITKPDSEPARLAELIDGQLRAVPSATRLTDEAEHATTSINSFVWSELSAFLRVPIGQEHRSHPGFP